MSGRVLVITGPSAAGKTTLATILSELLGERVVNSGDLLRAHMQAEAVEVVDDLDTGDVFLDRFDEDVAGEVIARGAARAGATIIDGVRLFSSLEAFTRQGNELQVVVLSAPLLVRHARLEAALLRHGDPGAACTTEHTLNRKAVWDRDIPSFRRVARWQFENDGPLERLGDFARSIATRRR